ncbi:MAG: PQQ-binding-like beta-propeller repeat protein [Thermoguttaceae bacterium]|jgi:outer membrane protein assembly factor BamB
MNHLPLAVVPVLIGPLQVLMAILPWLLLSLGGLLVGMFRPRALWAGVKFLWRQKLAVGVLAAAVTGSVFLVRTISFAGPAPGSAEIAGEDWPVFRGDALRRGNGGGDPSATAVGTPPPADGGLVWSYAGPFFASPAVVGNRLYVSSADKGPMCDRGAIYCLDADSGALVWKAAPRGYVATFSSPVVAGRFLVCGEGLHYTVNARVVCLDVLRQEVLWTYTTHGHVESTPCIDKGRVYVGAGDDGYYCLQLEPDAEGRAVVLWHAPTERCPDADTAPAVHDGRLVVGCGMYGNAICCLDADTGDELWRVPTPYPVFGAPTLVGGRVVLGMGNGNYEESAEEVKRKVLDTLKKQGKTAEELAAAEKTLGPAGEVWCLDEKTGRVQWKFVAGDVVLGAVAASEDRLLFAASDGYVYALSTAGKELGRWNAHAPIVASPAVSGGLVYVVTKTGKLYGLRTDDLELAWEATLGFAGRFLSSPAVARGHVYVGSEQYGLLCVGRPGGRKQEPCWAGGLGGPGCGGTIDNQPLPDKGKFGWRFPKTEDSDQAPDVQFSAPPACLGGALYLPVHGGRNGLVCVREDPKRRNEPQEAWFAAAPNGVWLSPAAGSQAVYFVDGRKGDARRQLRCVSPADGSERWKLPVAADAPGEFVLLEHGGLVADGPQQLSCFSENGEVAWRAECGAVCGVPAASEALLAVATDRPPALLVLDCPSGATLWRMPLEAAPTAPPLVRKNTVYLGTKSGVAAFRLADGGRIWEAKSGPPSTPLVLAKNRLAYVTAAGQLVVVGLEDGRVEKTLSGARAGIAPLASPGALVYAAKKGLMSYPSGGGEPRLWMNTDWLGQLTAPPVMANSRVYFATAKKGLISASAKDSSR